MADELTRPLGLDPPSPKGRRWLAVAIAGPIVVGAGGLTVLWLGRDPGGTEVRAAIAGGVTSAATPATAMARRSFAAADPAAAPAGPAGDGGEPALSPPPRNPALTATADGGAVAEEAPLAAAARADLVEKSPFGPLPRIGDDGTLPMQAYASPAPAAAGMAKVAIVIAGIGGGGETAAAAALDALPAAVTLAFPPDAVALPQTVAAVRAAGHEILLQVPLEPYGFPQVNPGPHTLTIRASAAENLADLHWLMGRLTAYVGAVNYMGARFAGDPAAMAALLRELGRRGLLYLDDGSAANGAVAPPATPGSAPLLRADLVLDADTTPAAIDARLDALAAAARAHGAAIATGSAFPVTIDRVAAFAKAAASRGIALVPITALLPLGKS
jgi:polysaccharide deacetylase 2 family uncharacterized protein YibQ